MIIYYSNDLIFSTKIKSTADTLGIQSRPVRDRTMLQNRIDMIDDGKSNNPITGFILDLDTGDEGFEFLEILKNQLPNIPIAAFGAHVAVDLLQRARKLGIDFVMPRSAFSANLPDLLERMRDTV